MEISNVARVDCPTLSLIRENYDSMAKGQKRIADYILCNPSDAAKSTIVELMQKTETKSESSIVKFYRNLGFTAYNDFKFRIVQEIASRPISRSYEDILENDSTHEIRRKLFNCGILTLSATERLEDDGAFEEAAKLMINARRIILLGYAASAAVCYYAQFRFLELGLNCMFSSDSHVNAALMVEPNPDDLFFCVSMSGKTRELVEPLSKFAHQGNKIIVLTGTPDSLLGQLASVVIPVHVNESQEIVDAMSARLAQICSIDVLFTMLSLSGSKDNFSRLREIRKTFKKLRDYSENDI